jgi:hypothetical protein
MSDNTEATKAKGGKFFAVEKVAWRKACELGIPAAMAYLVLARGTRKDNRTTKWARKAVGKRTGFKRKATKEAVQKLLEVGLVEDKRTIEQKKVRRSRPKYRLVRFDTDEAHKCRSALIWLPNSIVDAADDEVSPIVSLRTTRNPLALWLFVALYGIHDLCEEGGLPVEMLSLSYRGQVLRDFGQFNIIRYDHTDSRVPTWEHYSTLISNEDARKIATQLEADPEDLMNDALRIILGKGLIQWIPHLHDSDEADATALFSFNSEPQTGQSKNPEKDLFRTMQNLMTCIVDEEHWNVPRDHSRYCVAVHRDVEYASLKCVARLRYQPRTKMTDAWYAQTNTGCERHRAELLDLYNKING